MTTRSEYLKYLEMAKQLYFVGGRVVMEEGKTFDRDGYHTITWNMDIEHSEKMKKVAAFLKEQGVISVVEDE